MTRADHILTLVAILRSERFENNLSNSNQKDVLIEFAFHIKQLAANVNLLSARVITCCTRAHKPMLTNWITESQLELASHRVTAQCEKSIKTQLHRSVRAHKVAPVAHLQNVTETLQNFTDVFGRHVVTRGAFSENVCAELWIGIRCPGKF